MRQLTAANVPFSFSYCTYNTTNRTSKGIKRVDKALLRTGLSPTISNKSEVLIGYSVQPDNQHRWFYAPLLLEFNGMTVKP